VERVYAGGNHSWALFDTEEPKREIFEPPSPLATDLAGSVSRDATPTKSGQSTAFERKPHFALQLVYSDVNCCHRFIRFTLKESMLEEGKQHAEDFVNEIYLTEQAVKYHRI
jgi:hypothetical protein